jgi:hypothetical protein
MPVNLNENSMQQFQNLPAHVQQRIADQSAMDRTGQAGGIFPASQAEQSADKFRSMTLDDAMYGGMDAALSVLGGAEKVFSPIQTLFPDISRPGGEFSGMSPEEIQQGLNSHVASYYDMVGRVPDETVAGFDAVTNPLTLDRANYPQQGGPDPDHVSGFMRFLGEGLTTPVNLAEGAGLLSGAGLGVKGLVTAIRKKMKNKMKSKPATTQPPRKSKPESPPKRSQKVGTREGTREELATLRRKIAEGERKQIVLDQLKRNEGRIPMPQQIARKRQQDYLEELKQEVRRLTNGQN